MMNPPPPPLSPPFKNTPTVPDDKSLIVPPCPEKGKEKKELSKSELEVIADMLTPNSRNSHQLDLPVGGIYVDSGSVASGKVGRASHPCRNEERAQHKENV